MAVLPWLSLGLWAAALVFLLPSVSRIYRGAKVRRASDEWRSVTFFAACLFVMFNGRRVFLPDDQEVIIALYSISISLAVFVLILLGQERE